MEHASFSSPSHAAQPLPTFPPTRSRIEMAAQFLQRRSFLHGLAGVTLGLPLLESIGSGPLLAQTVEGLPRFLSFHCSSGVNTDNFWPTVGTLDSGSF